MPSTHLTEISTRWVDENGEVADLAARVGRLGEDVSEFALRTLGWVRVVRFGLFLDIDFVPEAVRPGAIDGLLAKIDASAAHGVALWCVTARSKVRDDSLSSAQTSDVKRFVTKVLDAVGRPFGNSSATLERFSIALPDSSGRLHPMFNDLIATWKNEKVTAEGSVEALLTRWKGRSLKLMRADQFGGFNMAHYSMGPAGPWDNQVQENLLTRSLAVVPDRELAQAVATASRETLLQGTPTLERWIGPLLTSQGVKEYDWYRLTLPVVDQQGTAGVLVGCLQSKDALAA